VRSPYCTGGVLLCCIEKITVVSSVPTDIDYEQNDMDRTDELIVASQLQQPQECFSDISDGEFMDAVLRCLLFIFM